MTTPAGTPSESAVTAPAPMLVLDRKSNGRAIYDPEAKRALVQQCLQPGVSVAATALRAGVNANLLRKWICGASSMGASVAWRASLRHRRIH